MKHVCPLPRSKKNYVFLCYLVKGNFFLRGLIVWLFPFMGYAQVSKHQKIILHMYSVYFQRRKNKMVTIIYLDTISHPIPVIVKLFAPPLSQYNSNFALLYIAM